MYTLLLSLLWLGETATQPTSPLNLESLRISSRIELDGQLDEDAWRNAPVADGFRQIEPDQGRAASQDTRVRVIYDDNFLYFGVECFDDQGAEGIRVQDLRRDFDFYQNDSFAIFLAPFEGGRITWSYQVSAYGARRDVEITNGISFDDDWDSVWTSKVVRNARGWQAEIALPWSSLRFPPEETSWRVNFARQLRRNNELSGWSPWPRQYTPFRVNYAGKLSSLQTPPPSRNLSITPYAVGRTGSPDGGDSSSNGDMGIDLKWAPNPATVVDLTVNTDFAQAEVDRQVINLTRFSVFFPEKRRFFLENGQMFDYSILDDLKPFTSRRIGLDQNGTPSPIDGGARIVHQGEKQGIGGMVIRTSEEDGTPASEFVVGRYTRRLSGESRIGGLVTSRRDDLDGSDQNNLTFTLDGFFRPKERFSIQTMVSGSKDDATDDEGMAYGGWVGYNAPWGYAGLVLYAIEPEYNPGVGFIRDNNLVQASPALDLYLQPKWLPKWIRAFNPDLYVYAYWDQDDMELRENNIYTTPISFVLHNGGRFELILNQHRQELRNSFGIVPGIVLEEGTYDYTRYGFRASTDPSRRLSASLLWRDGDFYDGTRNFSEVSVRWAPNAHVALSGSYENNELRDLGLQNLGRDLELYEGEVRVSLTPSFQITAYVQHNTLTQQESINARLSWEFLPLSHVFLVYNESKPIDLDESMLGGSFLDTDELQLKVTFRYGL